MKRILYIHHAIGMGGAPRSLAMLVEGLDRARYEPIIAMPMRPGNEAVKSLFLQAGATVIEEVAIRPFNGSEVAPCCKLKEKAYALAAFPLLVRLIRRMVENLKPDIVHLNSTCLVAGALGVAFSSAACPTIAHVREPLLANRWGRLLAALNRRYVDYFISIDEAGLASVGVNVPNSTVVRNFVDTNIFFPDVALRTSVREEHGWKADSVVFLLLSRVSKSNGVLELLDAIQSRDAAIDPAAQFVIAGFEEVRSDYELEALRRIKVQPRCRWLPFTKNVPGILNAADIIVAPYLTSHSARCVFEGGAVGTPALITRLPNLMEQIREDETGLSFNFTNTLGFQHAVNRLCKAAERGRLGNAARDFTLAHFSADANIAKVEAVYERLLNP